MCVMGHRVPEGVDRKLRDDCALENRLPRAEAGRRVDLRHPAGQPAGNLFAFRSSWSGSGCWFESSEGMPVSVLLCLTALLFIQLSALRRRPKKKSTIKWKEKAMDVVTSTILAVASLREWFPPQTRARGRSTIASLSGRSGSTTCASPHQLM